MSANCRFLLVRRPHGDPVAEDFGLVEESVPAFMRHFSGTSTGKLILKVA